MEGGHDDKQYFGVPLYFQVFTVISIEHTNVRNIYAESVLVH